MQRIVILPFLNGSEDHCGLRYSRQHALTVVITAVRMLAQSVRSCRDPSTKHSSAISSYTAATSTHSAAFTVRHRFLHSRGNATLTSLSSAHCLHSIESTCIETFLTISAFFAQSTCCQGLLHIAFSTLNLVSPSPAVSPCRLSWKACPSQIPNLHPPPWPLWSTPQTPRLMDPTLL